MLALTPSLVPGRPAAAEVIQGVPSATHKPCRVAVDTVRPRRTSGPRGVHRTGAALGGSAQLVQECSIDNWKSPLGCDAGVDEVTGEFVVALGKFDAMHIGHRSLAVKASEDGCHPVLLSFSGIAQVLGLPVRLPLVAAADRPRVLDSWAPHCHGRPPRQRMVPFHNIRTMSPEQFVAVLAQELGAAGVVAGRNYRFGYKAAGDATALQSLGARYGMRVHIVDLVSASGQPQPGKAGADEVSSSKIRELLACREVQAVQRLLGRRYRLVAGLPAVHTQQQPSTSSSASAPSQQQQQQLLQPPQGGMPTPAFSSSSSSSGTQSETFIPAQCFLNMPPAPGSYSVTVTLVQQQQQQQQQQAGRQSDAASAASSNGKGHAASGSAHSTQGLNGNGRAASGDCGLQAGAVVQGQVCVCRLSPEGLHLKGVGQEVRHTLEQLLLGLQVHPVYLVLDFESGLP